MNFHDPNGDRPRVILVILARTTQGYLLTISRAVLRLPGRLEGQRRVPRG